MTAVPTNRLSLSEQCRTHANAYALVTPEHRWTYAELASQGLSVRHWLNARSLGPHTRCVAFRAPTTPSSVMLAWTLIDLRIPFVPLHPRWSEHDCDTAVRETNADLLQVPVGFPCVQPGVQQAAASEVTASDEATLAVVYTSGSSGKPKGARLSRRAFAAAARASEHALGITSRDRWYLTLPLGHIGGLSILTRCLWAGAAVALDPGDGGSGISRPRSFVPQEFVAAGSAMGITLASLVPTQLKRLCDARLAPPPTLRAALVGGAALDRRLQERALALGWPIYRTYGLTETCAQVATDTQSGATGGLQPLPGLDVSLQSGRLAVRGPVLFSGYVGDERRSTDRWFVTGDLARLYDDGSLQILGRADDVIVTGGENVHPDEVEAALLELDDVDAACVFGRPCDEWGEEVCAVVVARSSTPPSILQKCRTDLLERLAHFKVPKAWAVVDHLPVGPTGKISRAQARCRWASVCSRLETERN